MKNYKKKIIAGLMGTVMGISALSWQNGYNKNIAVTETVALTGYDLEDTTTGDTTAGTTTEADLSNIELEEEAIYNSTYLSYGEGCIVVTVVKDQSEEAQEEMSPVVDMDNAEESVATVTPEETAFAEESDEAAADTMDNTAIISSVDLVNACLTEEEKQNVALGATQEIRVTFHNLLEEELDQDKTALMEEALKVYEINYPGFVLGNYLQILFEKKDATTGEWMQIDTLNNTVELNVDIKQDFQVKDTEYYMVRLDESTYSMYEDTDDYVQIFTFEADTSGYYAMCRQDEVVATSTPTPTKKPSYWNVITSDEYGLCIWHWIMCGFLIIGLTWIAAVQSKKKRLIFMIIMDVLMIVCAFFGTDGFDWPMAIIFILLMFLIYMWKTLQGKRG